MEVKHHKHGKSVRFTTLSGFTFVHCKDLFTILGLDWNCRKVKNCSTQKIKCPDAQGKNQPQTFVLASHVETFLSRSKRTDKAQWLREVFLGATPQHKTLSEEKEERSWRPGSRKTRIVALVITPKTPSEPMNRCFRLGPDDWLGTALVLMTRPSASTASRATTWSPMGPCAPAR